MTEKQKESLTILVKNGIVRNGNYVYEDIDGYKCYYTNEKERCQYIKRLEVNEITYNEFLKLNREDTNKRNKVLVINPLGSHYYYDL